ncbi:MAG TPA: hypothetical protein PKA41_04180 [Verrucomicrobiota bacterium]|nr:hypothetical protein [Verrucomicrobiota bacterium]
MSLLKLAALVADFILILCLEAARGAGPARLGCANAITTVATNRATANISRKPS